MAYQVTVYRTFTEARPRWQALEATGYATAFQLTAWLEDWYAIIAPANGLEPRIVVVADAAGRDLMLLPLVAEKARLGQRIGFADAGVCDYHAPVCAADFAPDAAEMAAIWRAVCGSLKPASRIRFDKIVAEINGRPNPLMLLAGVAPTDQWHYGIALTPRWEDYLAHTIGKRTRKDINRFTNKMNKAGVTTFGIAQSSVDLRVVFDALIAQRVSRSKSIARDDVALRPDVLAFYRNLIVRSEGIGFARLFYLKIRDSYAGTFLALRHGNRLTGLVIAFDNEQWADVSPGTMTFIRTIEWCHGEALDYFDLTLGAETYKERLGAKGGQVALLDQALGITGQIDRAPAAAKRIIKANPRLHALAMRAKGLIKREKSESQPAAEAAE